ncbi:hypothetical protein HPB52_002801 [Rhipicephalus sanguineus]|uniref:Uncharacterized protein n=1 Tax=Rhipicephalus sanguineus TaxID=34632 RepID=A0A9D4SXD2_RHISA|nr:hypothetical protein HPB52_002801 [Rhipicephalus sanguineus]
MRVPIRPQAGPPGPFRNPKRRGAALTLTRRACTSVMERLAEPSVPPTTNDAPPVSPASCCATAAAVRTLSLSGDVSRPTPTTVDQPAAFHNSAHALATCNAGSVLETPSLTTLPPDPMSVNTASASQWAAHDAVPAGSAPGMLNENSLFLPSTIAADDSSTEMDFTASQGNEDNTSYPEGSWNTVRAKRKPASTGRPRTELITVGIQLSPGTLTPKPPLYDFLVSIIAAANLSPKTSAEVTVQAKPAQSLLFLKTHSPLTAHLLLSLTNIELNGKPITIKTYAPNSPISCLGVIHNACAEPPCHARPPLRRMNPFTTRNTHPGSYAAKVKGASPLYPPSSNNTPSPSMGNESRSFDLRLAMLERNQRVSDELQQKIHALTQTLETTTSSLTSELAELNKQLATLTAPTSDFHVAKLADMVETTSTAHHTRSVQLETPIFLILSTLETQSKQMESFTSKLNTLQDSFPPAKKKERGDSDYPPGLPRLPCYDGHATCRLWGYPQTLKPVRLLHCLAQERHLSLLNTPDTPARAGTASQRFTTPDLTFSRGSSPQHWHPAAVALAFDTPFLTLILTFSVYGVVINVCNALSAHSRMKSNSPPALMLCVLKSWLTAHPSSTLVGTRCVTASTPHCTCDPHGLFLDLY